MFKRVSQSWKVFGSAGLLMLLVLAVLGATVFSAGAQDNDNDSDRVISVSGSGEVFGAPDVAYVNLGIDVSDANFSAALEQANTKMAAIVKALVDAGVDEKDIQTVNFSVYPEDKYDPQTGQSTGERVYHVQSAVNVTVRDISKTGDILQAGLDAGANTVNGLTFGILDMKALEAEARKKAVEDARDRAQQLADAFGVTLGDPVVISETISNGGPVVPLARADMFVAQSAAPQISTGQLSVSIQVSVSFSIAG